jgi:hypothetical protein
MAVATIVVNTVAGPTAPIQWTDSAGGTAVTWWTPQLQAVTLAGMVKVNVRMATSADRAAVALCEIAVTNSDGSSPTVYGVGHGGYGYVTTTEAAYVFYVAGADISITQGQRLRIRLKIDDPDDTVSNTGMAASQTATLYFNGAAGATGDTYLHFPVTLQALAPYAPPTQPPAAYAMHLLTR